MQYAAMMAVAHLHVAAHAPDALVPWNKNGIGPVHVKLQEFCCRQEQACVIVSKSVGDEAWDVSACHGRQVVFYISCLQLI